MCAVYENRGFCTLVLLTLFSFVSAPTTCSVYDVKQSLCQTFPVRYVCANDTRVMKCFSPALTTQKHLYEFTPSTLVSELKLWKFPTDHRLYETFPIDPKDENIVRQVPNALFSITYPIPFKSGAKLVAVAEEVVSDILDLSPLVSSSKEFLNFVSGKLEIGAAVPLSHRYGGHQFGVWADQLGDGRAVMLGEYVNQKGERWELQLKGSGLTPYSRSGDGRAVVRSSVREFLCSEAMHYLGIPTSRAASLVISNNTVTRDQFYDGHPQRERTAVVLRLARSWFRIGSLEILTYSGETALLRQLVDFVIKDFFPSIDMNDSGKYLAFFQEVVRETAFLIAAWQSVGFAHGVCNTDNFSLLSITIDFGPFGFLDAYDPKFVPNTSDDEHRYSYENQPEVGAFNLEKLRLALLPLLTEDQKTLSSKILLSYGDHYRSRFMDIFRRKLGLETEAGEDDENLVAVLLRMMSDTKADFTMTFRELGEISVDELEHGEIAPKFWSLIELSSHAWFGGWVRLYTKRLQLENQPDERRRALMCSSNPRYILRNWIAQVAVEATEKNNFSVVNKLYKIFQKPFTYQEEAEEMGLASQPPYWASHLKVSCSS